MRDLFHEQLDGVFDDLADMCQLIVTAVDEATQALLAGDAARAETVISADSAVDAYTEKVEDVCFQLLSLQAPVAGDLRVVVAALRMVAELERMGDLAVHVAKIARLRVPHVAVPQDMRPTVARMADVAESMVGRVVDIIRERDVEAASLMSREDDEMDTLRRSSFQTMLGDSWQHGVEAAVDMALLGRYYERIADHAVSVAHRVVFVVTGVHPAGDS